MHEIDKTKLPHGIFEAPDGVNRFIVATAWCDERGQPATIVVALGDWLKLEPVEYAKNVLLSKPQPRRPPPPKDDEAANQPIPFGYIEWKNSQNWVVITGYGREKDEIITIRMTLAQWFDFMPVRHVVEDRLRDKMNSGFSSTFSYSQYRYQSPYLWSGD